jgi:DNA-binding transcriptional regulator GbsR (MarR family)
MDSNTVAFIERMGLALETDGLPRIAGRIFGLLLVSDDARSLDDLAAELQVSKGSTSTNARLLEQRGLLERVCRPADRRDYYRPRPDLFDHTMALRLARWERFHQGVRE